MTTLDVIVGWELFVIIVLTICVSHLNTKINRLQDRIEDLEGRE